MCALMIYGGQTAGVAAGLQVANGNGKSPSRAPLLAAAMNALPASVAVIEPMGVIVAVNDTWRRYADENGMRWSRYGIGYNYLSVLDNAAEKDASLAELALRIREVLGGITDSHRVEYPCQMATGCQFVQQVTAFDHGGIRHAFVSHENITPQKVSEAGLRAAKEAAEVALHEETLRRETAENRLRIAEAVADLLTVASSGRQIEDTLQSFAERIRQTMDSQATVIYCAEERWDRPKLMAASGTVRITSAKGKSPIAASILARAVADPRGVSISDVRQESVRYPSEAAGLARRGDYRGLLVTPIQHKDTLYGYVVQFYAQPREFCQEDVELAYQFGQQVSLALENAELRSQAERVAVENERNRLARDLHDAVTQTLFSASVVAEALPRVWERDPAGGRRALEDLRLWTRGALAEMRTLLMELRPAALLEKPLPDLVRQLGEAAATRLLIPVDCQFESGVEPPPDVKLALYRIAQEAISNIVKHSNASHVQIRYRPEPQSVQITIADDGRGFEVDRPSPGQMGLGIMHERARHIGALLTIQSTPGAGTELHVEWRPRRRKTLYE